MLFGIKVSKPCDSISSELEREHTTYQSANYDGEFVYSIESRNKRYNVVASNLWIHVNNLQSSSLIPMFGNALPSKSEYISTNLKESFKIS